MNHRPAQPELLPSDADLRPISRQPIRLAEATLAAAMSLDVRPVSNAAPDPQVSIVVVTHNNLPFTKMCLSSVLTHTQEATYEVIVVDNASTDGTPAYLVDLARRHANVRVITNDRNTGFAVANNQGVAASCGRTLVLLNNDTIVPPGWLGRLLRHLEDPEIGLVGPTTNRIGNEAEIRTNYRTYGEFLHFATTLAHAGAFDIPTACMFCLAMRREVFDRVGPLDEQFGVGMFEDDDYAMRARAAGYRVVCAEDAFVHHFGKASFGELAARGEYGALFHANRRRFEAKWGVTWQPHLLRPDTEYARMVERIGETIMALTAPGATVLVVSKGDDQLLQLSGRCGRHFPHTADGAYSGFHPGTDSEALAALREAAGDYLVIPATSAWWLQHYANFTAKLGLSVHADDDCTIFALASEAVAAGGRA